MIPVALTDWLGLLEQALDERRIMSVSCGIVRRLANFLVVDEVLGIAGLGVVRRH